MTEPAAPSEALARQAAAPEETPRSRTRSILGWGFVAFVWTAQAFGAWVAYQDGRSWRAKALGCALGVALLAWMGWDHRRHRRDPAPSPSAPSSGGTSSTPFHADERR